MELPEDVLRLIKEYSMPVTRHDWRTMNRMPQKKYIYEFLMAMNKRTYNIRSYPYKYNRRTYYRVFNSSNYIKTMYPELV